MPVNLTAKVVPLNDGFVGMVDAKQVLGGGTSSTLPDTCLSASNVTQFVTSIQAVMTSVNASIITAGTIDGDRLPTISASKKGGVPATVSPSGRYLKDDGTWSVVSAGGTPGGVSTQVQFHDTTFGGDAGFTYNKTTKAIVATGTITASVFTSTIIAAAPFSIASSQKVNTLNADLWEGLHLPTLDAGKYLTNTGSLLLWSTVTGGSAIPGGASTQIQFNDTSFGGDASFTFNKTTKAVVTTGTVTASVFVSTVAAIAPLTVASTTVVANLNADRLDGSHAADFSTTGHTHATLYVNRDGTTTLSGDWNAGIRSITVGTTITASRLVSTIGAGTSPLLVNSGTLVSTLNADLWDSQHLPVLDSGKFLSNTGSNLIWSTVSGGGGSGISESLAIAYAVAL